MPLPTVIEINKAGTCGQTTAAKVQRVIELSREALAAGGCVVIGMQGTGAPDVLRGLMPPL